VGLKVLGPDVDIPVGGRHGPYYEHRYDRYRCRAVRACLSQSLQREL